MVNTLKYLQEALGIQAKANPLAKCDLEKLPMYLSEKYKLYRVNLFQKEVILAQTSNDEGLSIQKTQKQVQQIHELLNTKVILVLENVEAYNRKRLIEKGINFIVPGKQMFLPDLLIDLKESYPRSDRNKKDKALLPSAQFLLIYQILCGNLNWKPEAHSFKNIAKHFGYTPMTITNAMENLKKNGLIDVVGEKEKYIRFRYAGKDLWNKAKSESLLVNPVIKTVFVDAIPDDLSLLQSNTSALPAYSDLSQGHQQYYAIEKDVFYALQKRNALLNANPNEGKYALEVWKYKPSNITGEFYKDLAVVDPLSLCLSMQEIHDERIEMALDQILRKYLW